MNYQVDNGALSTNCLDYLKRESHDMTELDVEVAAARFAKSRKDFMVFVSTETGQVNVLYRRKDGELGLIEPEGEQD